MRLVILGATGSTGRHVTEQALARGHEATTVVRNSLGAKEKQCVVFADVCKPEELVPAFTGQDGVLPLEASTRDYVYAETHQTHMLFVPLTGP